MEKKLLKSALFGYSKTSVCEYIAAVNEEFSQKLMESAEEHKKEKEEWKERTAALEQELAEYKKVHQDVATIINELREGLAAFSVQADERLLAYLHQGTALLNEYEGADVCEEN